MAELADALDLGSSSERSTGSIPARCTSRLKCAGSNLHLFMLLYCILHVKYSTWFSI